MSKEFLSMEATAVKDFPRALEHGSIKEVFKDVFFVTGAMETVLMDMDWKFSRNMTVIREGERLIILNSVRLNEDALAELDKLGKVTDVIRLGALHGRDDPFYVDRYNANYWAMPGMDNEANLTVKELTPEAQLPISDASVFQFSTTQIPETILFLEREGGIAIGCDALQNWLAPDEYFCESSKARMQEMGFFSPANVGPVWMQVAAPKADDFVRLKEENFSHAFCGHGAPLLNNAKEAYLETFSRLFDV